MLKKLSFFKRKITIDVVKNELIKGFDEIPGPRGVLGIGNFYNYTKTFGKYSFEELHKAGFDKYEKYGSIVCERMFPGYSVVWIYEPTDIANVFNDGPGNFPCRRSHLALEKFRKDRPEHYNSGGLLPTNGQEWWKLRSEFQKGLSSPQNVRQFLPRADEIMREFIQMLPKRFDDDNLMQDMLPEIERLNLELTCLMAFDERMNSFSDEERDPNSRSSRLIKAGEDSNSSILPTDQGFPLWKFFETAPYKKLRKSQEIMQDIGSSFIEKRMKENRTDGNSLLDQYLRNPNVNKKDILGTSCDLLLGGVHTGSFTTCFALHHISKDKRVQDLMHEEAKRVLPNENDEITTAILNSEIPYTRAVLKETFRLNPISIGIGRNLNHDTVLGGYLVPKNTTVVTLNFVACRLEKNFSEPLKFKPERWLKTSGQQKLNVNPYLVIPFGHGMRSCIARRFAEQSILVFLLRLMRMYSLEWKGVEENMDFKTELINRPSCDITLKFNRR